MSNEALNSGRVQVVDKGNGRLKPVDMSLIQVQHTEVGAFSMSNLSGSQPKLDCE